MTITSHVFPRLAIAYTPEKRKIKRRPETGYKLNRKHQNGKHLLLTEHEVLEARWLHEIAGWTIAKVHRHYGVSYQYASNLLSYKVRSKLRTPRADDFPPGHTPKPAPRGLSSLDAACPVSRPHQQMEAAEALDFLLSLRVSSIELEDGRGCIDVANTPGGLLVALEQAKAALGKEPV